MGEALARLKQLRDCFARDRKRLEAIPKIGVSDDGQPYIREVAEALQSFAAWFGELTLDDMGLFGSAYRLHGTWDGLDAIADWVGLHRSQQFAIDVREHAIELFKQSEALDAAVSAAFMVKGSPAEVVKSRNRRIPRAQRDAIDDGIQSVASLAEHLAIRLQRIAVMAGSQPTKTNASRGRGGRNRKGIGGRPEMYPAALVRKVVAAREKYEKNQKRLKQRILPRSQWLFDFCGDEGIDTLSTFPSKDPQQSEAWDVRSERFWRAARKRLRKSGH